MYKIYMTNFHYYLNDTFETLEAAIMHGRHKGFEFSVFKDGYMVGFAEGVALGWRTV